MPRDRGVKRALAAGAATSSWSPRVRRSPGGTARRVVPRDGAHATREPRGRSSSCSSPRSSRTSRASRSLRRGAAPTRLVLPLAAAIQLVPLAAPLLLSTDAWTYWGYGWIAGDGGGNPYVDPPSDFPQSPAAPYVGADWRDTTTVYGPAFTLLSEPVALVAGRLARRRGVALQGACGASACSPPPLAVARGAPRPALAVGLRRLEPRARDPPRRRGPQRRARRRARRARRRAGGAAPAGARRCRVGARDLRQVDPAPLPRGRGPRRPRPRATDGARGRGLAALAGRRVLAHLALRPRLAAGARAARGERGPSRRATRCPRASSSSACPTAPRSASRSPRPRRASSGSRGTPRAASRATAAPRASCSRRRPTSPSGTSPGPCRSRRSTRTASHGSPRSRSRRTSCRRRSRSERSQRAARGCCPRRRRARTDRSPGAGEGARERLRRDVVVAVAPAEAVDGDPLRLAEHGEAEDPPALGEVRAERVRRAHGCVRRDQRTARAAASAPADDVLARAELGAEGDEAPDGERPEQDAGDERGDDDRAPLGPRAQA